MRSHHGPRGCQGKRRYFFWPTVLLSSFIITLCSLSRACGHVARLPCAQQRNKSIVAHTARAATTNRTGEDGSWRSACCGCSGQWIAFDFRSPVAADGLAVVNYADTVHSVDGCVAPPDIERVVTRQRRCQLRRGTLLCCGPLSLRLRALVGVFSCAIARSLCVYSVACTGTYLLGVYLAHVMCK